MTTINVKKRFKKIILDKILGNKNFLLTDHLKKIVEPLEERSKNNQNENVQFTEYFWKLGLAMH